MSTRRIVTTSLAALAAVAAVPVPATLANGNSKAATHGGRALWAPETVGHHLAPLITDHISQILQTGRIDLSHADARYIPMYLAARGPVFMVGTGDIVDPFNGKIETGAGLSIAIFDGLKLTCDGVYRNEHAECGFTVRWPHADENFLKRHADRVRIDDDRIKAWIGAASRHRNPAV